MRNSVKERRGADAKGVAEKERQMERGERQIKEKGKRDHNCECILCQIPNRK